MPITTTIDPPLPGDSPEVFDAKAFAAWAALAGLGAEINASSAEMTTKVNQAAGSATAAANSANAADASRATADASKNAAAASASTATTKASEADASKIAAAASATTASNAATAADASKTAAAGSATTATTKAGEAAASATTASGAATTATTKAGEASNSATTASAAATTATTKAGEASASATTASNAATTATTKAGEASNSATTATTKAGEASASASAAEQAKLDAQAAAQSAAGGGEPTIIAGTTGQYWRGDKTWQALNSAAVGLGNVNNTSDASKPISTAQQTALDGKAAASHSHSAATTGAAGFMAATDKAKLDGIASGAAALGSTAGAALGAAAAGTATTAAKSDHVHAMPTKADVGLGNVDNTTDAAKPVSTATQAALNAKLTIGAYGFGGLAVATVTDCNTTPDVDLIFNASSSSAVANRPGGAGDWVIYQGCTASGYKAQRAESITTREVRYRQRNAGTWSSWVGQTLWEEPIRTVAADNVIDCSKSMSFFKSVNGNTAFSLTGMQTGVGISYTCRLHVEHYAGSISFSGATFMWAGGAMPTLTAAKNHVFTFSSHPTGSGYMLASVVTYS